MEGLLEIWRARYTINTSTQVADLIPLAKLSSSKKRAAKRSRGEKKGRHVLMVPGTDYELLRDGIAVANERAIDDLLLQKKCDESYFYIFRHTDPQLKTRNPLVPVYEAAYWCVESKRYVRVQKCHLKQAYLRSGRTDATLAETIGDDGLPYWVDRQLKRAPKKKK